MQQTLPQLTIPDTLTPPLSNYSVNNTPGILPQRPLSSKILDGKIKLVISEKLQNQIRYHCDKVSKIEWSGILFYTTEGGTYGDKDFKVIGQELYLMDIGDETFTSYTYDFPFLKMLMANPALKAMHKGHIHSHHNMSVFFSGTDTNELLTNSGSHNYYVSLIVNNINEMTAKVAYRVCRQTKTTISYKAIDGSPIEEEDSSSTDCTVMIYDCDIDKAHTPDGETRSRFCEIRDRKVAENAAKRNSISNRDERRTPDKRTDGNVVVKPHIKATPINFYKWQTGEELTPGTLFDEVKPEFKLSELAPVVVQDLALIQKWMINLIGSGGYKNQLLSQVLGNINRRMSKNLMIEAYLNGVFERFEQSYEEVFGENVQQLEVNERIKTACTMLNTNYGTIYGSLVNKIITKLKSSNA